MVSRPNGRADHALSATGSTPRDFSLKISPSRDDRYPTIPIPELQAHAKGLPYLAYLLGESQETPVLSPHGVVKVRLPVPERYAVHKMIVSPCARIYPRPLKAPGMRYGR